MNSSEKFRGNIFKVDQLMDMKYDVPSVLHCQINAVLQNVAAMVLLWNAGK